MTQAQRRIHLIKYLLAEDSRFRHYVPETMSKQAQKALLRSLMNTRMPVPASEAFIRIQDEYLKQEIADKGITDIVELAPVEKGIFLWQGDITTLRCDAIVNAANSQMLGCFVPCHNCIDNCIHTFSGIRLRIKCNEIMKKQGHEEPTGTAKITPAYNLPCRYILHTVGPIVNGKLTDEHKKLLASCYHSCLKLADKNGLKSIAFCCISTGVFGFEQKEAANIAVETVREYKKHSDIQVVFNVFKDDDYNIYEKILNNK